MKQKKKAGALLLALIIFAAVLTACGQKDDYKEKYESLLSQMETKSSDEESAPEESADSDDSEISESTDDTDDKSTNIGFDTEATIKETVLYNQNSIKVTATELTYSDSQAELSLLLENNSNEKIGVYAGTIGFSCTAVNNYMMEDGYLNSELDSKKKANETVKISLEYLKMVGITGIGQIDFGFYIKEDESSKTIFKGTKLIKTSQYDKYKDSKPSLENLSNNDNIMKEYSVTKKKFSKETIFNEKNISIISYMYATKNDDQVLFLEFENKNKDRHYVGIRDVSIDDLVVSGGRYTGQYIMGNTKGVISIKLDSLVKDNQKTLVNTNEIGTLGLDVYAYELNENDYMIESSSVKIKLSDSKSSNSMDNAIYNKNGIKIAPKGVAKDEWESSDDLHLLFMIKNDYSKEISISIKSNSLSVNGYMTNEITWPEYIKSGKTGIFDVEMKGSSLKKNKITKVSDVKEAQLVVEIKDKDYKDIDEVTLNVFYK